MNNNKTRTRFAPSPTGFIHIGNLRTALYAYLLAKKEQGDFLLRVEDTDQSRFVPGAIKKILDTLAWVKIKVDEGVMAEKEGQLIEEGKFGPYVQSHRLKIYQKYAQELVKKGHAYYCFCTKERLAKIREEQQARKEAPMYDKHCLSLSESEIEKKIATGEKYVIRLNVPTGEIIEFKDKVYGKISIKSETVDDQILLKADGFPTYHLAVVVDDHLMQISHVVRGEDWLPSTPKHILLYKFLGWDLPKFVHVPNVLGENHRKLSKRSGDVSVEEFINKGYLPEALLNFIALLGWNPKTNQELFSLTELEKVFDPKGLHRAGAVFDYKKLDWINACYIKQKDDTELFELCQPYLIEYLTKNNFAATGEKLLKIIRVEKERIKKLSEITENIDFYFKDPQPTVEMLAWKKMNKTQIKESLEKSLKLLSALTEEEYTVEKLQTELLKIADSQDRGALLWPLRVAISGKKKSPSPFEIAWILGKEKVIIRLENTIKQLD